MISLGIDDTVENVVLIVAKATAFENQVTSDHLLDAVWVFVCSDLAYRPIDSLIDELQIVWLLVRLHEGFRGLRLQLSHTLLRALLLLQLLHPLVPVDRLRSQARLDGKGLN